MDKSNRNDDDRLVIAHVVWSLDIGGLERIVIDLVNRLDPARFAHVVYCLEHDGVLSHELGASCRALVALGKKPGVAYALPIRLARLMRGHRVDVVHGHNFGPMLYGGAAGCLARARAIVGTLHGPEAAEHRSLRLLDRLRLFDAAIAISEHVRAVAVSRGGLDPSRVVTILNGVDTDRVARSGGLTRADIGARAGDYVIGVVARLSHEKDHDTLLAAASIVASKYAAVRLVVVGDGPRRSALEAEAAVLGIADRVSFLGSRTDVPDLLPLFDLFVLPSRIEGLGITLMEAMAHSLPTVATRVGGIPEVVQDGKTGLVVECGVSSSMAAAIEWMIDHRDEAAEMGVRGRRRVEEEFDTSRMVARYAAVYEELARAVSGRPGATGW
jgi:sugar transferase (PEP-CTERM/EpsH1 system associated)